MGLGGGMGGDMGGSMGGGHGVFCGGGMGIDVPSVRTCSSSSEDDATRPADVPTCRPPGWVPPAPRPLHASKPKASPKPISKPSYKPNPAQIKTAQATHRRAVGPPTASPKPRPAPLPPPADCTRVHMRMCGWMLTPDWEYQRRFDARFGICGFPGCPLPERHTGPHEYDAELAALL